MIRHDPLFLDLFVHLTEMHGVFDLAFGDCVCNSCQVQVLEELLDESQGKHPEQLDTKGDIMWVVWSCRHFVDVCWTIHILSLLILYGFLCMWVHVNL